MKTGDKFAACVFTLLGLSLIAATVAAVMIFATHRLHIAGVYWLVPIFGAIGGAVGGIIRCENRLELSRFETESKIDLGCLGDLVIGIGELRHSFSCLAEPYSSSIQRKQNRSF